MSDKFFRVDDPSLEAVVEKLSPANDDFFPINDSADAFNPKKLKIGRLLARSVVFHFFADQFDNPNNSDWAVNSLAKATKDTNNNAVTVRAFDDTTEEGVGFSIEIPASAENIVIELRSKAETAPATAKQVVHKLYLREFPDNVAEEAWSSGTEMNPIDIPTNEFLQYDTQIFTLASLELVAGRVVQIELTRNPGSASDTLVDDWNLVAVKVSFS